MSTPARTSKPRASRAKPKPETPLVAVPDAPPAADPPAVEQAPEPEKPGSQKTLYRISRPVTDVDDDGSDVTLWRPAGEIEAADAKTALKIWAERQGEQFAGGELEAVPVRNITRVTVGVETRRQLTIT